jgi:hypothetical protein
LNGIDVILGMD